MTVHIRLARDADLQAMVDIYRPVVLETMISFETVPPEVDEMALRVAENVVSHPWLVCEIDGRVAGYAYAAKHRTRIGYQWSVDSSVYVSEEYRNRGVGRGLYESLFGILVAQGYVNAYAGIALPNPASVALHESLGFELVGVYQEVGYKLGRWWDVGWWRRSLNDRLPSPAPPLNLAAVVNRPDWDSLVQRGAPFVRGRISRTER